MEIDELEDVELAHAVAEARGWLCLPKRGPWTPPSYWLKPDDSTVEVEDYRPDRDIAQAWELDGEGWRWEFGERGSYLSARVVTERYVIRYALVEWADFPTKARAYATARCRAFLKARAAQ